MGRRWSAWPETPAWLDSDPIRCAGDSRPVLDGNMTKPKSDSADRFFLRALSFLIQWHNSDCF
jgi:hypothetical protein